MSYSKKQKDNSDAILTPAPVRLANLQGHFKERYGFNSSQTEVMLTSSSKSLLEAFSNATESLKRESSGEQLVMVFHGLKGLLLNMGENDWAAFARDVEQKLQKGIPVDCERIIAELQAGMADILFYCRDKG
jgi:hypothetical protein